MAFTSSMAKHVNILVSNYTNNHITFNKGDYVGHLEPTIKNIEEKNLHSQANSDAQTKMVLLPNA